MEEVNEDQRLKKTVKSAGSFNHSEEDNSISKENTGLSVYRQKLQKLSFDYLGKDEKVKETVKYGYSEKSKSMVPYYIILPYGMKKMIWDVFISLIVVYQLFLIPFDIAFNKECFLDDEVNTSLKKFHIFMYICYMIDMIFNFFTALLNEKGEYEYDFEKIAMNYLKSLFIFDFATCIPLDILKQFKQDDCFNSTISYNKIPLFFSFIRLIKLKTLDRLIEKHINAKMVVYVRLFKVLVFFFYMCHLIGCLISGLSETLLTKLKLAIGTSANNIEKFNLTYSFAIFNGIYLILGNDITFKSNSEKIIIIFVNLISLITNANVFGYVAMLLSNSSGNEGDSNLRVRLDFINDFLNYQEVENNLKLKINDYNLLMFKRQRDLFYGGDIFNDLPDCLKIEAKYQMWKATYFVMDKLFANNNICSEFFFEAILKMKGKIFEKDERIIYEGEQSMDFYMIPKGGKCNVSIHGVVIRELKQGDYFGEIAVWLKSQKRSASVDSSIRSDFLIIHGKEFLTLLRNFPKEAMMFKNIAKENFHRSIYLSRLSLISQLIINKNKVMDCFFKKNLYSHVTFPNVNLVKIPTEQLIPFSNKENKKIYEMIDLNNGRILNRKFKNNRFFKMLKVFLIMQLEELDYVK